MAAIEVVEPAAVEASGLFTACAQCALLGAEVEVPSKPGRYVCSEACAVALANGGIPQNAVPSAMPVKCSIGAIIYNSALLNPVHIVDAAQWVMVSGLDGIRARVEGLHTSVVRYNITRGGPRSHLCMPLDPTLYNAAMAWARHYAEGAIKLLPPKQTAPSLTKEALDKLRDDRAAAGESEADLHAMTLWYVYATFWRLYLATHDQAAFCALSPSDLARVRHMRPEPMPDPTKRSNQLVSRDAEASLCRLEAAVSRAVKYLFELGTPHELIHASLVKGLFIDAEPDEFAVRYHHDPAKPLSPAEVDQLLEVRAAKSLLEHAGAGNEERFIRAVVDSHAGIGSWVKARFNRTVGRAKGVTSRAGYSWVTLADRLYQLALANKCDNGMIAAGAQLAIAGLFNDPRRAVTPEIDFGVAYQSALRSVYVHDMPQSTQPPTNWDQLWETWVTAAETLGRPLSGRDDRIQSYTCSKSGAGKLAPSVWRTLPHDIALQVLAMGQYLSMSDQTSGTNSVKREQRVKSDIKELVKELTRKVGSSDAHLILKAITPRLIH